MSTDRPSSVRILVVDDHALVRLGIRRMIAAEPDLHVVAEAASVPTALQEARSSNPNLAIVDLSLDKSHGLELIRALREGVPGIRVLVLSMHDELLFAERALRAGARGYIMKQEAVRGLVQAIREVLAGNVSVSSRVSQRVLRRIAQGRSDPESPLAALSDREFEVFHLIGRGLSVAAIAAALGVSVKTIETYRSNIREKLDLEDAAALIRHAARWAEQL